MAYNDKPLSDFSSRYQAAATVYGAVYAARMKALLEEQGGGEFSVEIAHNAASMAVVDFLDYADYADKDGRDDLTRPTKE